MKKNLSERLKKIENHTIKSNTMWLVDIKNDGRFIPYQVITKTGKEIKRLHAMTGEEFLQWQVDIGRRALPILEAEVLDEDQS